MFTVEEQTIINLYRQASSSMTRSEPVSYTHLTLPTNREV